MSNDVDVLFVSGEFNARMHCTRRPAPAVMLVSTPSGETTNYVHREFTSPAYAKKFHIAVHEGAVPTDEEIDSVIAITNFQPAWDLN